MIHELHGGLGVAGSLVPKTRRARGNYEMKQRQGRVGSEMGSGTGEIQQGQIQDVGTTYSVPERSGTSARSVQPTNQHLPHEPPFAQDDVRRTWHRHGISRAAAPACPGSGNAGCACRPSSPSPSTAGSGTPPRGARRASARCARQRQETQPSRRVRAGSCSRRVSSCSRSPGSHPQPWLQHLRRAAGSGCAAAPR